MYTVRASSGNVGCSISCTVAFHFAFARVLRFAFRLAFEGPVGFLEERAVMMTVAHSFLSFGVRPLAVQCCTNAGRCTRLQMQHDVNHLELNANSAVRENCADRAVCRSAAAKLRFYMRYYKVKNILWELLSGLQRCGYQKNF